MYYERESKTAFLLVTNFKIVRNVIINNANHSLVRYFQAGFSNACYLLYFFSDSCNFHSRAKNHQCIKHITKHRKAQNKCLSVLKILNDYFA